MCQRNCPARTPKEANQPCPYGFDDSLECMGNPPCENLAETAQIPPPQNISSSEEDN